MTDSLFTSIKLPRDLVAWLKVQAAKARLPLYAYIQQQLPDVPKTVLVSPQTRRRKNG